MNPGYHHLIPHRVIGASLFLWVAVLGFAVEFHGWAGQVAQGPYLGQEPPGTTPKIFAPGIVSTAAHEFSCSFTPDGREFYFTRRDPARGVNLIMVTKEVGGTWTPPEVVPFIQNRMAFEPRVTPDGGRLYFTWEQPFPNPDGSPMSIWFVQRKSDGWSNPIDPGRFLNPMKAMYVSLTLDGTIYTSDISRGPGTEGIAVSRAINGKYGNLERLPAPVNVGAQDMYPYVAPDESYLIFASRRQSPPSSSGLFVSSRKPDGTWGEPRAIDLGMPAGLPLVSPDGKYLFFTAGERGKSDIYWVDARLLEQGKRTGPAAVDDRPGPAAPASPERGRPTEDRDVVSRGADRPAASKPAQDHYVVPDVKSRRTERMVEVGGRKLHTMVYGQGAPAVVLVSGTAGAPQASWNPVIDPLAAEATVVTYDRAGVGKSEIGSLPTDARQSSLDLRRLLDELKVPRPILLVGHSYGVMVVKLFASLFPEVPGGLVLMDGVPATVVDAQRAILTGAELERLEQMTSRASAPPNPRTELDYIFESREQELKMGPLPRVPTLVLIAGAGRENGVPPGFSPEARRKMAQLGADLQKKMATDLGGRFIVLDDVSHDMHLEKPEPIVAFIKGMIQRLRTLPAVARRESFADVGEVELDDHSIRPTPGGLPPVLRFSPNQRATLDSSASGFPTLGGPYLGQAPPGPTPQVFAPGILSLGFHEHNIAISPDGREIFFVAAASDFSRYLIMSTRLVGGSWTMPAVAPFSGGRNDGAPSFSPDGRRLYFSSRRPRSGSGTPSSDFDIWYADRQGDSWTDPVNLGSPINGDKQEVGPSVASDGTLYFQRIDSLGTLGWDLYVARYRNGAYSAPEKLPAPVNTDANEAGPFIARDGSYLLFQSNRPGSYGVMDLYVAHRTGGGGWTAPVNLGIPVNSSFGDWAPVVSPDGRYLFFGSFRNIDPIIPSSPAYLGYLTSRLGAPTTGKGTLYWVDARTIAALRPTRR